MLLSKPILSIQSLWRTKCRQARAVLKIILFLAIYALPLQQEALAQSCDAILNSSAYISARSSGKSEAEAKANALNQLVGQITALVSARTDMKTFEINKVVDQAFVMQSKSLSQLRLDGLSYELCPKNKKDNQHYAVAYISHADLEKSAAKVASEVHQYMNLIESKKTMGLDHLSDVYVAYLTTFFSPYPIAYESPSEKIQNIRAYLEAYLRKALSGAKISCIEVREHAVYAGDHIVLNLLIEGVTDERIKFLLDMPSYNTKSELSNKGGSYELIMNPVAHEEIFKGKLSLKASQIPTNLLEIESMVNIGRDISITANMSDLIEIDFTISENDQIYSLAPNVKNLSVRSIEWLNGDKVFSTTEKTNILKKDITGGITLRLNRNDHLTKTKQWNSLSAEKVQTQQNEPLHSTSTDHPPAIIGKEQSTFAAISSFADLQKMLGEMKSHGKASIGKKQDFVHPDKCWVFLVHPDTQKVMHVLTPMQNTRTDLKENQQYSDFELQLKGYISLWVEVY